MNDRELLLLAAKAIGMEFRANHDEVFWNPLVDDKEAFRLMVKLKLLVDACDDGSAEVVRGGLYFITESSADAETNTRRAIVRAAAAIGEQL